MHTENVCFQIRHGFQLTSYLLGDSVSCSLCKTLCSIRLYPILSFCCSWQTVLALLSLLYSYVFRHFFDSVHCGRVLDASFQSTTLARLGSTSWSCRSSLLVRPRSLQKTAFSPPRVAPHVLLRLSTIPPDRLERESALPYCKPGRCSIAKS